MSKDIVMFSVLLFIFCNLFGQIPFLPNDVLNTYGEVQIWPDGSYYMHPGLDLCGIANTTQVTPVQNGYIFECVYNPNGGYDIRTVTLTSSGEGWIYGHMNELPQVLINLLNTNRKIQFDQSFKFSISPRSSSCPHLHLSKVRYLDVTLHTGELRLVHQDSDNPIAHISPISDCCAPFIEDYDVLDNLWLCPNEQWLFSSRFQSKDNCSPAHTIVSGHVDFAARISDRIMSLDVGLYALGYRVENIDGASVVPERLNYARGIIPQYITPLNRTITRRLYGNVNCYKVSNCTGGIFDLYSLQGYWDTTVLPDEHYRIVIIAEDYAGHREERPFTVLVDNFNPRIIRSSCSGEVLKYYVTEELDPETVTPGNVEILEDDVRVSPDSVKFNTDDNSIEIFYDFDQTKEYEVTISTEMEDYAGNSLEGELEWIHKPPQIDEEPSSEFKPGQESLEFLFNQEIDTDLAGNAIHLYDGEGNEIDFDIEFILNPDGTMTMIIHLDISQIPCDDLNAYMLVILGDLIAADTVYGEFIGYENKLDGDGDGLPGGDYIFEFYNECIYLRGVLLSSNIACDMSYALGCNYEETVPPCDCARSIVNRFYFGKQYMGVKSVRLWTAFPNSYSANGAIYGTPGFAVRGSFRYDGYHEEYVSTDWEYDNEAGSGTFSISFPDDAELDMGRIYFKAEMFDVTVDESTGDIDSTLIDTDYTRIVFMNTGSGWLFRKPVEMQSITMHISCHIDTPETPYRWDFECTSDEEQEIGMDNYQRTTVFSGAKDKYDLTMFVFSNDDTTIYREIDFDDPRAAAWPQGNDIKYQFNDTATGIICGAATGFGAANSISGIVGQNDWCIPCGFCWNYMMGEDACGTQIMLDLHCGGLPYTLKVEPGAINTDPCAGMGGAGALLRTAEDFPQLDSLDFVPPSAAILKPRITGEDSAFIVSRMGSIPNLICSHSITRYTKAVADFDELDEPGDYKTLPEKPKILTFPNPTNFCIQAIITMYEPTEATVVLYDVLGKRLWYLPNREYPTGSTPITIDFDNFDNVPSGTYFLTLQTPYHKTSSKILLTK